MRPYMIGWALQVKAPPPHCGEAPVLLFQQQGNRLGHLKISGQVAGGRQGLLFRLDGTQQKGKSLAVPLPYAPGKGLGGMGGRMICAPT